MTRDASGAGAFGISRRRLALTLAGAVALVAIAATLIGHAANYHTVLDGLSKAQPIWFPVCLAGEILAYLGYTMAYRDVARVGGGPVLGLWTATRVVVIGFGAFVIGSSAGGLAADYWALHKASGRPHQSARRVLGMNTFEWAVLSVLAWISAAFVLAGLGRGAPLAMTLSWLIVVPICVALAVWFTQPERVERFTKLRPRHRRPKRRELRLWLRWLGDRGHDGFADAIGGVVVVRELVRQPRRYPAAPLGFTIYWAGDILTLYAALRAFGTSVPPVALVLAYTSGYVISALPLPAGGAGATEATVASTIKLIGVPFAPALLGAVVYRVFSFWLPIIPALLCLPLAPALADDLDKADLQPSRHPLAELTGEDDDQPEADLASPADAD
jgi:uncharacterized membrane protein YbhN (UPF0104 family)